MSVPAIIYANINHIDTTHTRKKIKVDFDALKKRYHIDPEDKGVIDFANCMTLREILKDENARDAFLEVITTVPKLTYTARGVAQIHESALTFKTAVETVANEINEYGEKNEREEFFRFDLLGKNLQSQLILATWNIQTERTDVIPKPPQHGDSISSANVSHNANWLGAILSMFREQKYINTFGYKSDIGFWIKL